MISKIIIIITALIIIYSYIRLAIMYLSFKKKELPTSAYERVIALTKENNGIHLVETKSTFNSYNIRRKVIKLNSSTYNSKGLFPNLIATIFSSYSLIDNNFLNILSKFNLSLRYLTIIPLLAIIVSSIVTTPADAKIALIILIIFLIYLYYLYDLNYQAISNLKEKPEELINDLNNYIMCSKLFFFAILLETLAISLILLGF